LLNLLPASPLEVLDVLFLSHTVPICGLAAMRFLARTFERRLSASAIDALVGGALNLFLRLVRDEEDCGPLFSEFSGLQ
jgi:hypothetical protein